jgi:peptidyl-prolyl cis-trans isomerase D
MASREARRRIERKAEKKTEQEKRLERHPAIFAISFIILVVVIISFIFYGSMGRMGSGFTSQYTFGKYGSKEISLMRGQRVPLNYYTSKLDTYSNEMNQAKQSQQDQSRYYWRQAFNDTAYHYGVLDLAKANGYMVSKDRIIDAMQDFPIFKDRNGDFSEAEYKKTSPMERTQVTSLLEEQLIHKEFIDDVLFSQNMSSKEVNFYKSMASAERKFNFVSFKYVDFPEDKVIEYGKTNLQKFKKIRLSRILLVGKSQHEAEDIQNRYNLKEKSFEDLAKTYSKDIYAEKGGNMEWQYYYQINVFIESADSVKKIFALKKDEVTLIKNGTNWEIYKCTDPAIDPDTNDPATRKIIVDYMMKSERGVVEDYSMNLAKAFKDKAAKKSFADAAKEIKQYPAYETEFFPINYQDMFPDAGVKVKGTAPSLASAASNKQFFQEAFSLSKDTLSNPIPLDDQVVVLKLIEEKTLTDEDWSTKNNTFRTGLQLYQYDPVMRNYVMRVYQISKENNQPLEYFLSLVMGSADKQNIPYTVAFDETFFIYRDFKETADSVQAKMLTDNFDDTFAKMTKGQRGE